MFAGKAIVITGAASGIGLALARRFARDGAFVAVLDQDREGAERTADDLTSAGGRALAIACDVTVAAQCDAAIQQVESELGGVDVLVNNAGITQISRFTETDLSVYRRVMDVNFFGAVNCTKAALSSLRERRGQIAVMSSVAGIGPLLGRTGYCASKFALHGFFETLREELRDEGVGVTIACPTFTITNLEQRALAGDGQPLGRARSQLGKTRSAEEVAEVIYRGVLARKPLVLVTPLARVSYWVSRLAPGVYARLMRRQFRSEL